MTPNPIFIPSTSQPDTCPQCKQNENKITQCRNCGYEYKEGDATPLEILGMILLAIVAVSLILFVILCLADWSADFDHNHYTLVHVAYLKLKYLYELTKRIY